MIYPIPFAVRLIALYPQLLSDRMFTVSPHFHRHHDTYATFLIAPSVEDSIRIALKIREDNVRRGVIVGAGGPDPGRDSKIDWSQVRIGLCCYMHEC